MTDFFGSLTGGNIRFTDERIDGDGPLPTSLSGPEGINGDPDGRYNFNDSLLSGITPYAYGQGRMDQIVTTSRFRIESSFLYHRFGCLNLLGTQRPYLKCHTLLIWAILLLLSTSITSSSCLAGVHLNTRLRNTTTLCHSGTFFVTFALLTICLQGYTTMLLQVHSIIINTIHIILNMHGIVSLGASKSTNI
jgi:hypothetical protein